MALADTSMPDTSIADGAPADLEAWMAPAPAFDSERQPRSPKGLPDERFGALDRLRALHGEAGRNLRDAQFLARAPSFCVTLMVAGSLALLWAGAAGGASLKPSFAWAALVLFGIVAIIRLHIRGFARSLRRTPLAEAAADLRLLLLYCGLVWGGGAFLIMPDLPAPALVFLFAAAPSLGLALALGDANGFAAFAGPASLLTAGAGILGAWPLDLWVAGAILTTVTASGAVFWWRQSHLRQMLQRIPTHS